MSKNIGYHTRLYSDNTHKVVGGSFGGTIDQDTVNRLVNSHFEVLVKDSGTAVFVDREGREVTLYLSVDASKTEKGAKAIVAWRKERDKRELEAMARREREETEIEELMDGLSHEEIVRRLTNKG